VPWAGFGKIQHLRARGTLGLRTTGCPEITRGVEFAGRWTPRPQLGAVWVKLRPHDLARFGQLFFSGRPVAGQTERAGQMGAAGDHHTCRDRVRHRETRPLNTQNHGYLWWVDNTDGADAYLAGATAGSASKSCPRVTWSL
jgi:CubicO group peptidase (beta-lactamase class C family)